MRRWWGVTAGVALSVGALASCSEEGGSKEAFCREVAGVPTLDAVLADFSRADAEELTARLDSAGDAYARLRDAAPDGIRDDAAKVVDLVQVVIDAVDRHGDDPQAAADQLRTDLGDRPDVTPAAQRVARYAARECDVDLDGTQPDEPPTSTSTTAVPGTVATTSVADPTTSTTPTTTLPTTTTT